jgi:hypothetical protein
LETQDGTIECSDNLIDLELSYSVDVPRDHFQVVGVGVTLLLSSLLHHHHNNAVYRLLIRDFNLNYNETCKCTCRNCGMLSNTKKHCCFALLCCVFIPFECKEALKIGTVSVSASKNEFF